jgi:hypothetical protein
MTEISAVDTSAAQAAPAPNLLTNPGFEQAGPDGPYWDSRNVGKKPAAAGWGTYIQPSVQNPVITEDLLPSTCPGGGTRMLHVTLNGTGGIVQTFTNPAHANFSVWVFVVKGKVGAGAGHGGNQGPTKFAGQAGTWQHLTGSQSTSPANEFIVYGTDTGYNDFYVDLASVTAAS